MKRSLTFIVLLLAVGLFAAQLAWSPQKTSIQKRQFSEKANLALRQTGHRLLELEGDHSSPIPPVQQVAANEFILKLENEFNYDTLPYLLAAAFNDFGISENYHVSIKNCHTDTLILGYNLLAFENKNVSCLGREQKSACNNIGVVFENKAGFKSNYILAMIGAGLIGLLLFFHFYFYKKTKKESIKKEEQINTNSINIGNTLFDFSNQFISINGQQKQLTFRENKLLHYFAKHPNHILKREKILSEVWGDEGLIVGRSLDVFISRLRKILKEDDSVNIKNVHGVGYRLEVNIEN